MKKMFLCHQTYWFNYDILCTLIEPLWPNVIFFEKDHTLFLQCRRYGVPVCGMRNPLGDKFPFSVAFPTEGLLFSIHFCLP